MIKKTVKRYKYSIGDLSRNEYNKWYSLMSLEKKRRVDGFRFAEDKKLTVCGEMLARKAIAEQCAIAPESIIFGIKEHGKPYAKGLPIEFNISHSEDIAVCAVNDTPIGIDIEKVRPVSLTVAKRVCTDEELLYIFGHTPTERDFAYTDDVEILTRFFEIWTQKEARGKCSGYGLFHKTGIKTRSELYYDIDGYIECLSVQIFPDGGQR